MIWIHKYEKEDNEETQKKIEEKIYLLMMITSGTKVFMVFILSFSERFFSIFAVID